ncbi:RagB/SusD family nutrient uptake outer membrane protein [Mucilaginibacter auburnensis]|uniref:Putative outer membrane starch-binding protein n=1 Tax=Mucilaginibacter auburnensis TaxID=1457233 RepID=A0A2H9VSC7_9SPHI|nr:RagB/SusD family nutrient uptake outer membrane protein [Mucilaginibacter auburnensis]PJJ83724.1 putative outer membrane starch-binding protein [Mucilaginibacter auburnensis]
MRSTKFLIKMALVATLTTTFSCKKYLNENVNKSAIDETTQWASETNADIFLNGIYGQLTAMHNTPDYLDSFTDDNNGGIYWRSWAWRQGNVDASNNGGLPMGETQGGSNGSWADWDRTYQRIRRCNLFIQKVTENKGNVFTPTWAAKRIDEARFLRAYWYGMLWQHVGGVPIITKVLTNLDGSEIFFGRNTFEETLNFVVSEMDAIIANNKLAVKYNNGNPDAGRATLGAALMVKGWLQLYAASPLFNSASYVLSDPGKFVSYGNYDVNRWATAAATFKKFMDTYTQYSLYPKMSEFWYVANEYNSEVIWDRQQVAGGQELGQLRNNVDQYGGPVYILGVYHTWGNYNPTQELVDTYRMANGLPPFIYPGGVKTVNPASGYDPQKPYVGREKRFYDFIVFDGATYKQDWMATSDVIYTRIDKVKPSKNEIDFGTTDNTNTGYFFKKKLNNLAPEGGNQSGQNYVYYRYAEVLLGYAEAQNEAVGVPDASVYAAVNAIRTRPGTDLPAIPVGSMTQSQMRDEIRDQRRIEFAFEAKRFYDIIRWKTAETVLNVDLHAMKITNTVPADNSGVWQYDVVPIVPQFHKFTPKMYMNPVPQAVMDVNPKLKGQQNPGY